MTILVLTFNRNRIRRQALFLSLFVLITGCSKTYIQLFDTGSSKTFSKSEGYVYETDTVKLTYVFWAKNGIVSFSVYNKLEKPIYIDWKNSSFIHNDAKLDYWIDEELTNTLSQHMGYYYSFPIANTGISVGSNKGIENTKSKTIKPEKLTFIPPKSKYGRSQFYIYPIEYFIFDINTVPKQEQRNDKPKKTTDVYIKNFTSTNSPLHFRNYLSFSFSENSVPAFSIDNEFYLTTVREMDSRHFDGKLLRYDNNENPIYERPFMNKTSFYIELPENYSTKYRKSFRSSARNWLDFY